MVDRAIRTWKEQSTHRHHFKSVQHATPRRLDPLLQPPAIAAYLCSSGWVVTTKRIEDVATTGPDRGADAIRYPCLWQEWATELKFTLGR